MKHYLLLIALCIVFASCQKEYYQPTFETQIEQQPTQTLLSNIFSNVPNYPMSQEVGDADFLGTYVAQRIDLITESDSLYQSTPLSELGNEFEITYYQDSVVVDVSVSNYVAVEETITYSWTLDTTITYAVLYGDEILPIDYHDHAVNQYHPQHIGWYDGIEFAVSSGFLAEPQWIEHIGENVFTWIVLIKQ